MSFRTEIVVTRQKKQRTLFKRRRNQNKTLNKGLFILLEKTPSPPQKKTTFLQEKKGTLKQGNAPKDRGRFFSPRRKREEEEEEKEAWPRATVDTTPRGGRSRSDQIRVEKSRRVDGERERSEPGNSWG